MIELYINGERLELNTDTKIAYSLQINDLFELRNRQANFTNKFSLPKTKENLRIIGHTDNLNSQSLIPYQKLSTKLIDSGIELMSNGNSYIESIEDKIEISAFDGNDEWFEMIKDLKLTDLDLSALEHNRTLVNVYTSSTHIWSDGYIYPIIRMFYEGFADTNLLIRKIYDYEMFPFVFVKYLFGKIITPTGYFFSGDFYDSDVFENLIISTANFKSNETTNLQLEMAKAYANIYGSPGQIITDANSYYLTFLNITENFNNQVVQGGTPDTHYHINADGKYSFFVYIDLISVQKPQKFRLQLIKFTTLPTYDILAFDEEDTNALGQGYLAISLSDIDLNAGDNIGFTIEIIGTIILPVQYTINNVSYFKITNAECQYTPLNYNLPINLSDLNQADFIKSIAQKFGLFFQTDNVTKEIKISKFSDIYKNKLNAYDWSDKLDLSKPIKIEFQFGDYGQTNKMVYSNDTDLDKLMTKEYAEGSFVINNELLEAQKEVITSPFSATRMIKYFNQLDAPFIQITKHDNIRYIQDFGITTRILILDRQILTEAMIYENIDGLTASTNNVPMCYFELASKTENLDFQTLIDNYYSELAFIFDKTKLLTAYFNLTAVDIHNIDLTRPVFIKSFSEYFYINKISDYLPNNSTKVELIRL